VTELEGEPSLGGTVSYEFDDFVFDPETYCLEKEGEPVSVEPKVLELLSYLIRNRDRVISKEELLTEVWQGRYVSESALNRCIYEVRRALGKAGKRYVVTVHGRGYRFTGEQGAESSEWPALPDSARGPSRQYRPAVLIVALAAVLIGAAIASRPFSTEPEAASGVREGAIASGGAARNLPVRLALLPTAIDANDRELRLVGLMMTDLLLTKLRTVDGLIVRPPDYTESVLEESQSLGELAARAGVSHVIASSMSESTDSESVRLVLELHSFPDAGRAVTTPLGAFQVPVELAPENGLAGFIRIRDAIAAELIERLAPALALPNADPLVPESAEAFRLYLIARDRLEASFCEAGGAIELLNRALEIDPDFTLGWQLLAVVQYNQVWACGAERVNYERARESAARALEIDPRMPGPMLIEVLILVETSRVEEAYDRVLALRRLHPDYPEGLASQAYVLRYAGYLEEAERSLRSALEIDPLQLAVDPAGNVPNSLLYQGKVDEYLALLPANDSAYHRYYRGFAEMLRDDEDRAREILDPAFRSNPSDLFARFSHALLAILEGDKASARAIVRAVSRQRRALQASDGEVTYKQAQLLALAGDTDGALADLALAIDQGFFCSPYIGSDPALQSLRNRPEFERAVATAEQRHLAFGRRFGLAAADAGR
jgi:DNA-binding winged helix-turn-helix (wHTH) protein/tetratricopeptide (TPR) repeat protein